jgi:hypothetical protein
VFGVTTLAILCVTIATLESPAHAAPMGETRARAIAAAFAAGDPQQFERAARENYSAAALSRRTPEQRAQALQQVFGETGRLEITEVKTTGNTTVLVAKGARGGYATFTFTIAATDDQRIENLSIQTQGSPPQSRPADPYAPLSFLIGEWDTPGGIHQSLRWGPNKSYVWYAVFTRAGDGNQESLHQEGLMTFNGRDKDFDFLFVHDPGSLNQEQGTVHVEADGRIVRETTAIAGDGTVTRFRQVWQRTGSGSIFTSLRKQKPDGSWAPNFPGSDSLAMTRRAG